MRREKSISNKFKRDLCIHWVSLSYHIKWSMVSLDSTCTKETAFRYGKVKAVQRKVIPFHRRLKYSETLLYSKFGMKNKTKQRMKLAERQSPGSWLQVTTLDDCPRGRAALSRNWDWEPAALGLPYFWLHIIPPGKIQWDKKDWKLEQANLQETR